MTNGEFKVELEKRTVAFSVLVLKMLRKIHVGIESRNIKDQVARSVTAIGANYIPTFPRSALLWPRLVSCFASSTKFG